MLPVAGMPLRMPVAALKATPDGSVPLTLNAPVPVTVKVPAVATVKVVALALKTFGRVMAMALAAVVVTEALLMVVTVSVLETVKVVALTVVVDAEVPATKALGSPPLLTTAVTMLASDARSACDAVALPEVHAFWASSMLCTMVDADGVMAKAACACSVMAVWPRSVPAGRAFSTRMIAVVVLLLTFLEVESVKAAWFTRARTTMVSLIALRT